MSLTRAVCTELSLSPMAMELSENEPSSSLDDSLPTKEHEEAEEAASTQKRGDQAQEESRRSRSPSSLPIEVGVQASDDSPPSAPLDTFAPLPPEEYEEPQQTTTHNSNLLCSKTFKQVFTYNRETFIFSSRVAVSMTIASLFVLLFSPSDPYPNAVWIVTTASHVSWLDDLNTATAVKKMFERSLGTLIGAAIGLVVGFLAFTLYHIEERYQAALLGVLFTAVAFVFPYVCNRAGFRSSYAAKIGMITVAVVALSLLQVNPDELPNWQRGMERAGNILLGSFIGSFSLLLWPKSTRLCMQELMEKEMSTVGVTANKLLYLAHDVFLHKQSLEPWTVCQRSEHLSVDEAFKAYTAGIKGWKTCSNLIPKLRYDPIFRLQPKRARHDFKECMQQCTHRCFRIYTTLMMMDAIVRSGIDYNVDSGMAQLLKDAGDDMQNVLDCTKENDVRQASADRLISDHLIHIRVYRDKICREDAMNESDMEVLKQSLSRFKSSPLRCLEQPGQLSLFFQLVEHLIVRSTQLYHFYGDATAAMKLEASERYP